MGIVFRQSIKSSIVIFTGSLLGVIVIYLSTLMIPKHEFGFLRYFTSQAVVASQVTMLGMNIVLSIYTHRYRSDDPKKPVLITLSLIIPVVVTVLLSGIYLLFKPVVIGWYHLPEDRANLERFYGWLPVFTLVTSLMLLLEHYLNSQLKITVAVIMREVAVRIMNIGIIIMYGYGLIGFDLLIILSVMINIIPIILLWHFCKKTEGFGISFNWSLLSKKEYRDIFHYAWYHMLMGISLNLLGYLDALMLGPLDKDGMSAVAEYNIASYIMTFVQVPYKGMSAAALPNLTKSYDANDMVRVNNYFKRAGINTLIAAIGMSLIVVLNMNNAVMILDKDYQSIHLIVIILIIGRLADMATGLNNEMISISKYYKFNFYVSMVLVAVIFVFNWLLIPIYGIYGAAWGTSLALVLFNLTKLLFLWKKMKLQPFSRGSIWVLVAGAFAGTAGYLLPFIAHPIIDATIRSVVILAVYTALLMVLKPSEDLNTLLTNIKKNKRLV